MKKYPIIWRPFTQMDMDIPLLEIESASGVWLYDKAGKKYLDAISSWWVNVHGHSHPHIVEAIQNQANKLSQVIFANATHEQAEKLAERLIRLYPAKMDHVFFSDDGSTSVEVAIKIALQYFDNQKKPRKNIIALEGAYHGDTFGAMSVSERNIFTRSFHSFFFDVEYIPVPNSENISFILEKIQQIHDENPVAALIVEPLIQGSAGMIMYEADVLDQIWEKAKSLDIKIIADEVMTGFGRTGSLFTAEQLNQKPDLVCLSKGLTGGFLPMGLTLCTSEVFNEFLSKDHSKTFFHGHSYTGNALSCAAANASLDLFEKPESIENIKKLSKWQKEAVKNYESISGISGLRTKGTIFAFELQSVNRSYTNPISLELYKIFISKNMLIRPLGNTMYVMPPYVITETELKGCHEQILDTINRLKKI